MVLECPPSLYCALSLSLSNVNSSRDRSIQALGLPISRSTQRSAELERLEADVTSIRECPRTMETA
eukprot:2411241-Alexandrium_andersonii.AAC.1